MPVELDIVSILDNLDGYQLTVKNYQTIQNALEAADTIRKPVVEKLFSICVPEMKADLQFAANILNIILTILKKLKQDDLPDILHSLVAVFHILKNFAVINKVGALKKLCFKIIMHYPDETMISLVEHHPNELIDLINLYCTQREPMEVRLQVISVIFKLLKILPPDKKQIFIAENISTWFSKIIPFINDTPSLPCLLDTIELLTEDLIHINYINNPHWKSTLECICNPQKYPALMKNLLETHNENWYRIWIVLIKLLKRQITDNIGNIGINPMLSVVEMAFKNDVETRCKAFACWRVLIDNFSTETNETYIVKKIKLLIIPLTLHNAKVEETALAKLKTWYHLIYSFHRHLEKFSEVILTPFLHFCFGKCVSTKPICPPGMISNATKALSVKAFINIVGHSHCLECVNLPRLKDKIISTRLLINHWSDWTHCLYSALKICGENKDFTDEQILCLWKGLIGCIAEFPEDNIRQDLVSEVISVINRLTEGCNTRMSDIIFIVLIPTLLEDYKLIKHLIVSKDDQTTLINKIINILLKLPINHLEKKQVIIHMKPLTKYVVEQALINPNHCIESALNDIASNGVLFWTAVADTICEKAAPLCPRTLRKIMLLPFGHMESFISESLATTTWLNLYNFIYSSAHKSIIDDDVFRALMACNGHGVSNIFILNVAIAAVKQKISLEDENFEQETLWLLKSINRINQYQDIKEIFTSLSELVVQIIKHLTKNHNEQIANNIILIVIDIIKLIKENDCVEHSTCYEQIFKSLGPFIKIEAYSKLKLHFLNNLRYFNGFINKQSLRDIISNIFVAKDANVKEVIKDTNKKQDIQIKFTTPNTKTAAKKSTKTEANIVKTVVENGEEFVVIKSNWKFNPKKLTDAQKEKLEQKRVDIPALYQDLSQSQDDFKMSVWKTDSQDTTTSSKSTSEVGKEDISTICKNIQSDFVPKVLENIITQHKVDATKITPNNNDKVISDTNKTQMKTKSPRLALKDRVHRNVRKLMKTSDAKKVNPISTNSQDTPMTPPMVKTVSNNVTNSEPAIISADRPSRLKKIPKKFADLELYGMMKIRRSLDPSDVQDFNVANSSKDLNAIDEPKIVIDSAVHQSDNKENDDKSYATVNITEDISFPESNTCEIFTSSVQTEINDKMEVTETLISTDDTINKESLNADFNSTNEKLSVNSSITHNENMSTPISERLKLTNVQKSSNKRRKSRIESELAIDMVEGHPFLDTLHTDKRVTRKTYLDKEGRMKAEKLNNIKTKTSRQTNVLPKKRKGEQDNSILLIETQNCTGDIIESQDVIESSQESTVTTISLKTHKLSKVPVANIESLKCPTQCATQDQDINETKTNSNDDIELPYNKIMSQETVHLTQNKEHNSKVVSVEENIQCTAEAPTQDMDSIIMLGTAEAPTQDMDSHILLDKMKSYVLKLSKEINNAELNTDKSTAETIVDNDLTNILTPTVTQNNITITMTESLLTDKELNSSSQDDQQRKKDFLNNTQEISPIKNLSPMRENKSPSPETSSDYVVIKLSSPVQASNGEPFDNSPEVFSEEKSPDSLNQSPPRDEIAVKNTSPPLTLNRNRPQMRYTGRVAQMLGLCADVRMEEVGDKKSPSLNSSARRNLKMFNSSDMNETDEGEDCDNFLKLKRTLPASDCSPSGPILKRKLADITDEATVSPASKRKRVSFHDPPVSNTMCVNKYIEPMGIRSPQNSSIKRQGRQLRSQVLSKSPRRLENVFKLDSVLNKAVESFSDSITPSNDTELTEQTPTVEVVKSCDLNDTDPICPDLIQCQDSISNVARELSSPAMKELLIKEFEGKVANVGDLAKMTELEINRSCIKAPKVQTARKVLNKYLNKLKLKHEVVEEMNSIESVDVQVNVLAESSEQTDVATMSSNYTQTESRLTSTICIQTDESGCKSTVDIVTSCLSKRTDFLETLCSKMDETSKRKIAETLPFDTLIEMFVNKVDASNCNSILNRITEKQTKLRSVNEENVDRLSIIKDFLCDKFENKDILLFCSKLFKDLYDRS